MAVQNAEYSISQLAGMFKVSQPYITQNVRMLEEYGLITTKRGDGHATKVVRAAYSRIVFDFTPNSTQ
jgi:DNA-binding MarR family transcriptional regulator